MSDFQDILLEKPGDFFDLCMDKDDVITDLTAKLTWKSRVGETFDGDLIIPQQVQIGYREDNTIISCLFEKSGANIAYFGNRVTKDGAISLDKDDRGTTGEGAESAHILLDKVASPAVTEIPIIATIFGAAENGGQSWGGMEAVLTLIDNKTGKPCCHYNLGQQFANNDTVIAGALVRSKAAQGEPGRTDWRFCIIGTGFTSAPRKLMEILRANWSETPVRGL